MKKTVFLIFSILNIVSCTKDDFNLNVLNKHNQALPFFVKEPENNVAITDKVELGRLLFWDPILSGEKDIACSTCHHPNHFYTDNIEVSIGVGGLGLAKNRIGNTFVKRNSPTVLNTAFLGIDKEENYNPLDTKVFWDNRAKSLEEQALKPIASFDEMRGNAFSEEVAVDSIVNRLNKIETYQKLFYKSFGDSIITKDFLAKALAAFERSLITPNSSFDRYSRGDLEALTQDEIKGLEAFNNSKCTECHSGPMFSDFELHNIGVNDNPNLTIKDNGNGKNQFRTPSLRNVVKTDPYMHNGVFKTLEEVIDFYEEVDEKLDPKLKGITLSMEDKDLIVLFLKTLTDNEFDRIIPNSVPSGLIPGGMIQKKNK